LSAIKDEQIHILVFALIAGYAYAKLKRLHPGNVMRYRMLDLAALSAISMVKNIYTVRSDVRNVASLVAFALLDWRALPTSPQIQHIREDFFFSCSGWIILSYFFM
jgi:hypothetical protein